MTLVLAQGLANNAANHNALVALDPVPAIGALPPNFNYNISTYTHMTILWLIQFYNEDFQIVQGDPIHLRVEKFHSFLAAF
ncbi:hypothetical protein BGW80DRAFT_677567 [Lactifluus volemus]|nr:hypothetical protein BGW80DRAFT_677567 [Lactifluus volemus]